MSDSSAFKIAYQSLPELLVQRYPNLNFENHCYLRIALDHVIGDKWDTKVHRPAYQHLTPEQLINVVTVLRTYLENKPVLLQHHSESLAYRKKWKNKQTQFTL